MLTCPTTMRSDLKLYPLINFLKIGELASIVQQGKVGFPKRDPKTGAMLNHHHQTSDVTRLQNGIPEGKKFAGVIDGDLGSSFHAQQYHHDLSKIAEERHRMRQLERLRDSQEEKRVGTLQWKYFSLKFSSQECLPAVFYRNTGVIYRSTLAR